MESTSGDKTKKTFKVMQRQLPISTEHCGEDDIVVVAILKQEKFVPN